MTTRVKIEGGYEPQRAIYITATLSACLYTLFSISRIIRVVMLALVGKAGKNKGIKMTQAQQKKFRELVLYVAQKSADDAKFGSIKLNKIVAFSEMIHFAKTGKPITGASYMKQPLGVVARCMKPTLDELAEKRDLAIIPQERHGKVAKVPTALRPAKVEVFEPSEVEAIDEVLKALHDHHGTSTSDLSHRLTPNWEYLPVGVEIPVSALLYPTEYKLSPEETSHFKQLLRDTDWGQKVTNAGATA